jgi:hypothetical protein
MSRDEPSDLHVLIFEDNLMWAPRLKKSAASFGHRAEVLAKIPNEIPDGDIAIVNLSSKTLPAADLVPKLRLAGIKVLAHAGHKEKELLALGQDLGCDRLATNSEITHNLEKILAELRLA